MSRMYDVRLVLKQIVDTSDDVSLAQHDFVPHGHEFVLHVCPQSMHKIYDPVKKVLKRHCPRFCVNGLSAVGDGLFHLWTSRHTWLVASGSKELQRRKII